MDRLPVEQPPAGRPRLKVEGQFAAGGYLGGEWRSRARDGRCFAVINKSDDQLLGEFPDFDAAETSEAIAAADAAGAAWASRTANERSAVLKKWHQLILENHEDLAAILTAEQGKP